MDDHHDGAPEIPLPSVLLYDPRDQEATRLSRLAHEAGRRALDGAGESYPVQFVTLEDGTVVVLELRGQSSATGHGRQGVTPARAAFLRLLEAKGFPVLLVFVEGVESYRWSWLHDLGPAQAISRGEAGRPETRRFGWPVREMAQVRGPFALPEGVTWHERAQGALV